MLFSIFPVPKFCGVLTEAKSGENPFVVEDDGGTERDPDAAKSALIVCPIVWRSRIALPALLYSPHVDRGM